MEMKEEVKALWQCCFSDSEEFIDLYFRMRYKEVINRAVVEEGRVISALQAIPYPMTCYGSLVDMAYISGACTHPDFRARGVMRELLRITHRRMYEEGICLSTLIPAEEWLRGYYARSGYATCFYYGQDEWSLSEAKAFDAACKVEVCAEPETEELYAWFREAMRKRPNCVQHTWDDYRVILADLHLDGGLVLAARMGGKSVGMAFCVEKNTVPLVKEMLYDSPLVKDMLCRKVLSVYGANKLTWLHPADASALPLGMARITDVRKMLALYAAAHPEADVAFRVEGDEAIPENNGYYLLEQGTCREGEAPGKEYEACTIESLTRKLLSEEPPYMSLMLN